MGINITANDIKNLGDLGVDIYVSGVKKTSAFSEQYNDIEFRVRSNSNNLIEYITFSKRVGTSSMGNVSATISNGGKTAKVPSATYGTTYTGGIIDYKINEVSKIPCFVLDQSAIDLMSSNNAYTTDVLGKEYFYNESSLFIRALEGFNILSATYQGSDGVLYEGTLNVSQNLVSFYFPKDITYTLNSVVTEEIYIPPTPIFTLNNIDSNIKEVYKNNELIGVGAEFWVDDLIKFVVKDGYTFNNIVLNPNLNLELSEDKKTATHIFNDDSVKYISYSVTAKEIPPFYCYVYTSEDKQYLNSNNCNLYKFNTIANVGVQFIKGQEIILKTPNSYRFKNPPTMNMGEFTLSEDRKTATLLITEEVIYSDFNVQTETMPIYEIRERDLSVYVNFYINDDLAVIGMPIRSGDIIRAEAVEGREFYRNYINSLNNESINSVGLLRNTSIGYYDFELNDNATIGTYTIPDNALVGWMVGLYSDTNIVSPETVKGFNNVYLVDENNLKQLASERFKREVKQTNTIEGETVVRTELTDDVDYGIYMLGLINLPMLIDEKSIIANENIRLGNFQTNINAKLISYDQIIVDAGSIVVPLEYNDIRDFTATNTIIHLPYSESIVLDSKYVVGETISVEYVVNLYDGSARINIYSSKIDDIINTVVIDLNINIPYATLENMPSKNDPRNIELGSFNGLYKPYIEVIRNDVINSDNEFSIVVTDEGMLNGNKGFVSIDNISLSSNATHEEKEMITTLLKDGVFIND